MREDDEVWLLVGGPALPRLACPADWRSSCLSRAALRRTSRLPSDVCYGVRVSSEPHTVSARPGMEKWRRVPEERIRSCRGKSFRERAKGRQWGGIYGLWITDDGLSIRLRQKYHASGSAVCKFGFANLEIPRTGSCGGLGERDDLADGRSKEEIVARGRGSPQMTSRLVGKTALVTAAAQGIGREPRRSLSPKRAQRCGPPTSTRVLSSG